ncbi:hypothetical protein PIB30_021687 [Stylosanthes scabra]|uniref:Uncharacterized protein n=1 Tax=Stylosanthes scabra TaxID=79078 RepID=A0ABU6Q8W2_9FABA|nr:hypothetical protein [Stylosanthes scabra]
MRMTALVRLEALMLSLIVVERKIKRENREETRERGCKEPWPMTPLLFWSSTSLEEESWNSLSVAARLLPLPLCFVPPFLTKNCHCLGSVQSSPMLFLLADECCSIFFELVFGPMDQVVPQKLSLVFCDIMVLRRRSRRAARVEPHPGPAKEAGPAVQAAQAP